MLGEYLVLDIFLNLIAVNLSMYSSISLMVQNLKLEEIDKQSTSIIVHPYSQFVSVGSDKLHEDIASLNMTINGTLSFSANYLKYHMCSTVGMLSPFLHTGEANHVRAAKDFSVTRIRIHYQSLMVLPQRLDLHPTVIPTAVEISLTQNMKVVTCSSSIVSHSPRA